MTRALRVADRRFLFTLALVAASVSCRREERAEPARDGAASAAVAAASGRASTASAALSSCPAGRWEYDYSDRFLETIAQNSNSRVVKKTGHMLCTITGAERGSVECRVDEGVENVFETAAGGQPMTVTVRITGQSTIDYETAGPNRWRTTRVDASALQAKATAVVAGKPLTLPPINVFHGMDRPGTTLEFRCERDTLRLKPETPGVTTDWAVLKRAP